MKPALRFHIAERLRAIAQKLANTEDTARAEAQNDVADPLHRNAFIVGWMSADIKHAAREVLEYADMLRPRQITRKGKR